MFASVSMSATTLFAVILFTSAAVVFDLRSRRIPNWLTVSSGALGLVYHLATGGISGLGFGLGGFVVGFGVLLVLWLVGGGGGGDVKLMGAVGAWLGPVPTIMIFIGSVAFAILVHGSQNRVGVDRASATTCERIASQANDSLRASRLTGHLDTLRGPGSTRLAPHLVIRLCRRIATSTCAGPGTLQGQLLDTQLLDTQLRMRGL